MVDTDSGKPGKIREKISRENSGKNGPVYTETGTRHVNWDKSHIDLQSGL